MIAGFINRILGFLLRMILVRVVGDEGLGLFQMVYPLFMTLLLISTAGFPVAISKLIPERLAVDNRSGSFNLLKVSVIFVMFMSLLVATGLYFSAGFIAKNIYSDSRTYYILLAVIPALLISPLAAIFRGFFQGWHIMIPTAVSQITEQLSRFLATLVIISMVAHLGLKFQAAGIAMGISIGEFTGFLLLLIIFFYSFYFPWLKEQKNVNKKNNFFFDLKLIASLAVPITLGRIVNSLMMSAEAVMIPRQLQLNGLSIKDATSLYGQLSGMVEQLIYLPTVITIALTISLIPNISDAYARNNMKKIKNIYQDVIRITTYLGLPITVIFFTRGTDICQTLFGYAEVGHLLAALAFSTTFIYYLQVSYGMLNGLGKPQLALFNLAVGSLFKLLGVYYLTPTSLGIYGATLSIGLGCILSALLNFIAIGHYIGYQVKIIQSFIKPLLASLLIYLINPYLTLGGILPEQIENIALVFLMLLLYLFIMILTRAITSQDIARFKR